jgi:hypothetical protein
MGYFPQEQTASKGDDWMTAILTTADRFKEPQYLATSLALPEDLNRGCSGPRMKIPVTGENRFGSAKLCSFGRSPAWFSFVQYVLSLTLFLVGYCEDDNSDVGPSKSHCPYRYVTWSRVYRFLTSISPRLFPITLPFLPAADHHPMTTKHEPQNIVDM